MSKGSQRPQRNAPRPNRFNQSSESRATVGPGRAVLPGFSKGNPRAEDRHLPNSTDSIGSTSSSRAKGGSKPRARQTLGEERAADGQDGAWGSSDGFGGPGAGSDGSSCSFGVSQGDAEGDDDSNSDIDSIDLDMSASAVQARAAQSDEDLTGLGAECQTTAPDSVSPGRGTAPAALGTPALVVAASASSSPRTTEREKTRKSLKRAEGKRYELWPVGLLRQACAKRGIMRMTRVKDVDLLCMSLIGYDKAKGRESPYTEDLFDDSCSDESGKPPTPKGLPAGAILMTRTALKKGVVVGPEHVLKFAGQEYKGSELLAIIAKEDGDSGETAVNTRRTKNCIPRLLCLIVSDKHRPDFLQARLQCSRQQLDNKETGKNRGVWSRLASDFRDENCQVRNITDEQMVDDIDPNKVSQPEATAKKVYEMYNETKSLWNVAHANYKKSGSHAPWRSFCSSNRNVWYFGVAVQLYPDLIEVCSNLLPDDVAREFSGTQDTDSALVSTGTVEGDRKRRADSKVRSAESSTKVGTSGEKTKVEDLTNGVSTHFKEVVSTVMEAFKPEPLRVESTTGGSSGDTAERACAKLRIMDAHMESHGKCLERLEGEKAKGEKANPTRLGFLRKQADSLEAKIEELMRSGL